MTTNRSRLRARHKAHKRRNQMRGFRRRLGLTDISACLTLHDVVTAPRFSEWGRRAEALVHMAELLRTPNPILDDLCFLPA